MASAPLRLDLSAPPLQAVLQARKDGNEALEPYLAAASYLESLGQPQARSRATFIRRQCEGDSAAALFEEQREAWGIPRFREELVTVSDFRRGFLFLFRDHGTSWSDDDRARKWFYRSPEAWFVREYEMWVDDPDDGELCDVRHSGSYREILQAIVHDECYALTSPAFTDEEVSRWELRIRSRYGAAQAERLLADIHRLRNG